MLKFIAILAVGVALTLIVIFYNIQEGEQIDKEFMLSRNTFVDSRGYIPDIVVDNASTVQQTLHYCNNLMVVVSTLELEEHEDGKYCAEFREYVSRNIRR